MCRGGSWIVADRSDGATVETDAAGADVGPFASDADTGLTDSDVSGTEEVGGACDVDCGERVCVDGDCVACRNGTSESTGEICGFEDRGTIHRECVDHEWRRGECEGVWYRSCLEYHRAHPEAPDGEYVLDPDGPDGPTESTRYYCVMQAAGESDVGGWTMVADDEFEQSADGWSPAVERTVCDPQHGKILGGYGELSSAPQATLSKTFEFPPVPRQRVGFYMEFFAIDTWDPTFDVFEVRVDGTTLERREPGADDGSQICGSGAGFALDKMYVVWKEIADSGSEFTVEVTARTDEGPLNESWGIDTVRFLVR